MLLNIIVRSEVIERLSDRLAQLSFVHAVWLEGADANGRDDMYSDIDLWLDVDGSDVEEAFKAVKKVLSTYGAVKTECCISHPDPQMHQRFFRTSGLPRFCFLDVVVQEHGRDVAFGPSDAFLALFEREPGVVLRRSHQAAQGEDEARMESQTLSCRRWRWMLVEKEIERGQVLEALAYYHAEVLPLLIELLRLRFRPEKRGYGLKHVYADLPASVIPRLERLYLPSGLHDLRLNVEAASKWFDEVLQEILEFNPGGTGS